MVERSARVVIVGAGHAGGSAAIALRQLGWQGPITLLGAEPVPPYQRPPLSKAWLQGKATSESLALKPAHFYADNAIELRLSTVVEAIDLSACRVTLAGGERLAFDHLILATGTRLRKLTVSGSDLRPVLELRSAADAERLAAVIRPGVRLAIVGGGYIGLEVAATARQLGATVTVIEREPRLLARVASEPLSVFYTELHHRRGVDIRLDASVEAIEGNGADVQAVRLTDGSEIACDVVLVGIGGVAEDGLARAAGLQCANGIIVDLAGRTSDARVFAIGDCSERPLPLYASRGRIESVPNALEQAKAAAAVICGLAVPAPEVPWFWSDQYDVKLQIAGLAIGAARNVVRRSADGGKLAVFHLAEDGRLLAVEAVNSAAEFMGGRQLIAGGRIVDTRRLADPSVPMKALVQGA